MMRTGFKILHRLINWYPPYLGAGIKAEYDESDHSYKVRMKLKFFNRNFVNTQFGGSMYSMCDPFFMFLLMERLGSDYIVWDRSAGIKFLKPGKGKISARFHIPEETYEEIINKTETGEKFIPVFKTEIKDEKENIIALVEKELYIKKKERKNKTSNLKAG